MQGRPEEAGGGDEAVGRRPGQHGGNGTMARCLERKVRENDIGAALWRGGEEGKRRKSRREGRILKGKIDFLLVISLLFSPKMIF